MAHTFLRRQLAQIYLLGLCPPFALALCGAAFSVAILAPAPTLLLLLRRTLPRAELVARLAREGSVI